VPASGVVSPGATTEPRLELSSADTVVRLVPSEGGRVESIVDRRSDRNLLANYGPGGPRSDWYVRPPGGWDDMFPNDSPWGDYPAHGTIWSTPFAIAEREARHAAFTAELDMPPVAIRREYTLIDAPARGLKVDTEITARRATGPFLWSSHPMLAVEPGWVVSLGASAATSEETSAAEALSVEVDALMHGRFSGWAAEHVRVDGLSVPEPGLGWGEVIYVGGSDSATVHSSDGRTGTRVTWDRAFFRDLWVVTVSGFEGFDLGFLFEPSTTRPFRLEEAIARGQSRTLEQDERLSFWATVESVDSD
jgi:hypothetical protein